MWEVGKTVKAIRIISKTISTLLFLVIIALAVLLGGIRLFGLTPYTVLSGSMEPTYHVGSIIYVSEVDPAELKAGDPVTYYMSSGTVVTHRVVEVQSREDGFFFLMKGDANDYIDGSPVSSAVIIGKPVFSIPYMGYVSEYVRHPSGLMAIVVICAVILILSFAVDALLKEKPEPEKKDEPETPDAEQERENEPAPDTEEGEGTDEN